MITINNKWIYSEALSLNKNSDDKGNYELKTMIVPFGKISRNGVMYDRESIEKTAPQIVGKPLMYNHLTEGEVYPRGEWTAYEIREGGLWGTAIVYNTDYNKSLIEYLSKAENAHVSLQVIGDAEQKKEAITGQNYSLAKINNWLEISIVPVEGFEQAKVDSFECMVAESFKQKESIIVNTSKEDINTSTASGVLTTAILNKKEEDKEGIILDTEKDEIKDKEVKEELTPDNNNVIETTQEVPEDKKEIEESIKKEEYDSTMEDVTSILEDLKNRITALEQNSIAKESVEEDEKDDKLKESDDDVTKDDELKKSNDDETETDKPEIIKEAEDTNEDVVEDKKEEEENDKPKPPLLENMRIKFSAIDLSLKESVDTRKEEFNKVTKELFFKK